MEGPQKRVVDGGPRPPLSVEREIDGGLNSRAPAGPHHRNGEPLPGPGDWGGWVNSGREFDKLTLGLLELSSTCSWLDRSVSGQIVTTGRFPGWKAPTPNGLSRCYHLLADPLCKRYAVRVSRVQVNPTLSSAQVFETNRGPHMT